MLHVDSSPNARSKPHIIGMISVTSIGASLPCTSVKYTCNLLQRSLSIILVVCVENALLLICFLTSSARKGYCTLWMFTRGWLRTTFHQWKRWLQSHNYLYYVNYDRGPFSFDSFFFMFFFFLCISFYFFIIQNNTVRIFYFFSQFLLSFHDWSLWTKLLDFNICNSSAAV